jgi:zinc protease
MKNRIWKLISLIMTAQLLSCTSPAPKKTEVVKQPSVVKQINSNVIKLKPFREVNLENGLKIFFVRDMALPRIDLSLFVKVGQRDESLDSLGINYFTANLLEEGTSQYSANQLADQLAILGTDFSISPGSDFTSISIDGLTLSSEKIIQLFSEIIFKPAFKEVELNKLKKQVLANYKKLSDSPSQLADVKINEIMFKGNAFAYPLFGSEKTISKVKRADVIKHFLKYYRPNNSYLAVTGALTEEMETKVVEAFKAWPMRTIEPNPNTLTVDSSPKKYFVKYKKGMVQSEIRISLPLFPRNHPDHLKMRIANEIFGGGFVSRLNSKIRDQMGLTYSISSGVDHRKDLGTLDISTFTKNESTFAVLEQIEKELDLYVQSGISPKELSASKNLLMGQFPRTLETVDSFAFNLMYLDFHEINFNYLSDYYKNLERISLDDVNGVIRTYFDKNKMKVFVLGDNKIEAQLKSLEPQKID